MSEDFFGDLGKSISKYTQNAVDKTSTFLEGTKITTQISSENREIGRLYQKIGEVIVKRASEEKMELDPELQVIVDEIRSHNAQILTYKKQLADLKGMKICPSCHELIPKDVAFCPKCGAATQVEAESEPPKEKPVEAEEAAVDAEFEAVDELRVAEEVAEELQAEAETMEAEAEAVQEEAAEEAEKQEENATV